jgi:hypothetical protein
MKQVKFCDKLLIAILVGACAGALTVYLQHVLHKQITK